MTGPRDPVKAEINMNYIYKFSSYRAGNTRKLTQLIISSEIHKNAFLVRMQRSLTLNLVVYRAATGP